jgi:F0F1-type ATP synthase assembly protein I
MTGPDEQGPGSQGPPDGGERQPDPLSAASGYTYLSYLIGGMVLYGGIGWLVGRWTHLPVLFPVGMLVGLALGVALIIFRVTRS